MSNVMEDLKAPGELFKKGHFREALALVEVLWSNLPEDKPSTPNAYLLVEYAVALHLKLGDLEAAWRWANLGPLFNEKRQNLGEAEFLLGKVAFAKGELEVAKLYLAEASKKSNGRILRGEDPKYKKLISING